MIYPSPLIRVSCLSLPEHHCWPYLQLNLTEVTPPPSPTLQHHIKHSDARRYKWWVRQQWMMMDIITLSYKQGEALWARVRDKVAITAKVVLMGVDVIQSLCSWPFQRSHRWFRIKHTFSSQNIPHRSWCVIYEPFVYIIYIFIYTHLFIHAYVKIQSH